MAEADYYEPIRKCLELLFRAAGKTVYAEIGANAGFSERAKRAIPPGRDIVFSFLRQRPDLLILLEDQYSPSLVTVEIKEKIQKLDDIYQAKQYKEVFDAKHGLLITISPIQEELKRLCRITPNILRSAADYQQFFVIGEFDKTSANMVDWFAENPFENAVYWSR